MKMNNQLLKAMNHQVNAELYSSYLYLGISAYFEDLNLKGFANWMRVQSKEEQDHALKLFDYIHERDGKLELDTIHKPAFQFASPLEAFEAVLQHEKKVTARINDLVALAMQVKDFAGQAFLQWYVNEQVEEESSAKEIVDKLRLVGDNSSALFFLDGELAKKQYISQDNI